MKKIKLILPLFAGILLLPSCENFNNNYSSKNDVNKLYNYSDIRDGQVVDGEYSQFININVLSSYLGYGYDVINDPYMDKDYINMSAPILDMDKIQDARLRMIKEYKAHSYSYEGSSIEELTDKYSASFNVEVGVKSKKVKAFSGGIKASYKGSSEEKTYLKFYKNVYQVKTFNLYLTEPLTDIKEMISDEFYTDVNSMTAASLYNKYGTHLIREVAMGGRLELNSTWSSVKAGYSSDIEAKVNAHIKALSVADIDVKASIDCSQDLNNESVKSEIEGVQVGGKLVDVSSAETMAANKREWLDSLTNDLAVSALSGIVGENSLIPLWDLLPENMYDKKLELQEVFREKCEENYDEIANLYKLNKNRDVVINCDNSMGEVRGNSSPYIDGDMVNLEAIPYAGYEFDGWYMNSELYYANKMLSFDIHVNTTLEARFKPSESQEGGEEVKEFLVFFDKNGGVGGDIKTTVNDKKEYVNSKAVAPNKENYVFTGYYDNIEIGKGTKYFDSNMNIINQVLNDGMTLYAHWVKQSSYLSIFKTGEDMEYDDYVQGKDFWLNEKFGAYDNLGNNPAWVQSSKTFSSGYNFYELNELVDSNLLYFKITVKVGVLYLQDCDIWMAMQKINNGTFTGDLIRYKVDLHADEGQWDEVYFDYYISAAEFLNNGFQLSLCFGLSGNGQNAWRRGAVDVWFTPITQPISGTVYGTTYGIDNFEINN